MSSTFKPADPADSSSSAPKTNAPNLTANNGGHTSSVPFPGPSHSPKKSPQIDIDLHPPFPWDSLKAESLRAVCRDIVGASVGGTHVNVGGKRGEMIAFLKVVEELGRDKALELDFHDAEEPSATESNRKRKRTLGEGDTAEAKTAESGDDKSGPTTSPRRTMRTRKLSTRAGNTNGVSTPAQERTARRKSRGAAKYVVDDKEGKSEGKRRKGKTADVPSKRGGGVFDGVLLTPRKVSGNGGTQREGVNAVEKDGDGEQQQEQEEEGQRGSDVGPEDAGSDVAVKETRREPVVIMVERTVETVVDPVIPGPSSSLAGLDSTNVEQLPENGGLSKDTLVINTSLQDDEEEDVEMDLGSPFSASPEATAITLGKKVVQGEDSQQAPGAGPPEANSYTTMQATGGSSLIAQYESSEGSVSSEPDELNLTVFA
ncbi:hypothetical protein SERLADRAFT_416512 [Serpula lacrymans var. lacrymans S7.9]|uniref:Uncharacterized protein n=1 Tax=Serpula lacrymans var. lacrymans (strain S7.9) TaxID=578457 RepID=F8P1H1_SERL9|nr:uncharacterized protein SERLADRAFT_416512 [Serpula lacrymans var. lacrymans S7.9]EGO23000.1 hypothetical protein SERLADRAFT_416512 [Serpula lacrymans var. lacrymans S7.9]